MVTLRNFKTFLDTLDTQTPERASKNPVWISEGSQKARSGVSVPPLNRLARTLSRSQKVHKEKKPPKIREKKVPRNKVPGNFWTSSH